jgi:hypothetical protein
MMEFTVYDLETGDILRAGYCQEADYDYQAGDGEGILPARYDAAEYYVNDGNPIMKGNPPSSSHEWVNGEWAGNVEKSRTGKLFSVAQKQIELSNSIIVYAGFNLDADATARDNIQGKLSEIAASIALNLPVDNMVWRDADNILHTFATIEEYHTWLQGLAVAIAKRSTELYISAWTHKAAISQLSTFEEIENYNELEVWPV